MDARQPSAPEADGHADAASVAEAGGDREPSPSGGLREHLEQMRSFLIELDDLGRVRAIGKDVEASLGREPGFFEGRRWTEFVHPDDREIAESTSTAATPAALRIDRIVRLPCSDGSWRSFVVDPIRPLRSGEDSGAMIFARDVTPLTRLLHELQDSEDRHRALAENATDLIVELDEDGRVLFASPSSIEILGLPPERLVNRKLHEITSTNRLHPDDAKSIAPAASLEAAADGRGWQRTYRLRHADGSWRWYESRARSYRNRSGAVRMVVTSRDVSQLLEARADIAELEKRYAMLGRTSRDVITETAPDHTFLYVSSSSKQVLGYEPEELLGRPSSDLVHPDDLDRVRSDFWTSENERGVTFTAPWRCRCKDGSYRWCEGTAMTYYRSDGTGPYVVGLVRDVHERMKIQEQQRLLEERMQGTQRLEGLGVMAGGIAHDFNNLLTPILGQASLALMDLPEDSTLVDRLQKIRSAARHAAKLTNQMLAYAGSGQLVFESLDLSELVREMGQLLEGAASGAARIHFELGDDLPPIRADSAQISQVVMNLITNAVEAVEGGSGRIALRTSLVTGDSVRQSDLVVGWVDRGAAYVCFEVEDDGCGMSDETRLKIFDPFFTTKFTGRGLGLAATLGIVRGHDGAIELDSEPGRGTRFRVLLPPGSERIPKRRRQAATERWCTSGTVLVADDDEGVRDLTQATLRRCGLTALCARDGREAIRLFREHSGELRAVLLDRTMPGLSGLQVLAEMRTVAPQVPIVLVSGYSEERMASELTEYGLDGILEKPFLPEALTDLLRNLLEG